MADAAVIIGSLCAAPRSRSWAWCSTRRQSISSLTVDKPITEPSQLAGMTIAAPPGDSQRVMWPAFANANGIDQNSVTWINIEPTAKIAALAEKRADGHLRLYHWPAFVSKSRWALATWS
ncbi:MAG: ABC transporter substrate-binding protein [Devosia ginsengisoli]|nr:ABC transporter substrate-binding protein [Devosia ginsengisoli]MCR6669804.1 ABC transporter substrate-binding protein [Devosia ginsengisoli]